MDSPHHYLTQYKDVCAIIAYSIPWKLSLVLSEELLWFKIAMHQNVILAHTLELGVYVSKRFF
jgi:hypothetical protein